MTKPKERRITIKRNDPQMPGKPTAFFLDCSCGWGEDYISKSYERAKAYAEGHKCR